MAFDVQDFEREVIRRSHEVPVLVDFWASWCGPCLAFAPVLEKLAGDSRGRWDLVKVNTEEHEDLAVRFQIRSLPTVKLFVDGEEVDQFMGARPEGEVLDFVERHLTSPFQGMVDSAREALDQGKAADALALLDQMDEKNDEAWFLVGLARLASDPSTVNEAVQRVPLGSEFADRAHALGQLVGVANSVSVLPEGGAKADYVAGVEAMRQLDWDGALARWISVMQDEPEYANGSAREACKSVFQLLGLRHPATEKHHRMFSSLLYS